jgi:hypothetical protein
MCPRVHWQLRIQHSRRDEELLQEEFQAIALVDVIHEDQSLALSREAVGQSVKESKEERRPGASRA